MSGALDQWYLFPASILIATIAMTSGIGGAIFFSPLFILVLTLEPAVAVGTALTTELFGFSSGVVAYWHRRLIDYRLGRALLMVSIPAAVVGSLAAELVPAGLLKAVFRVGVTFIRLEISRSRHAAAAAATLLGRVLHVIVFAVPGVNVGGQIGPHVQARVDPDAVKVAPALLFALVGVLMLATVAL